jgi:hypothetical protein
LLKSIHLQFYLAYRLFIANGGIRVYLGKKYNPMNFLSYLIISLIRFLTNDTKASAREQKGSVKRISINERLQFDEYGNPVY